MRIFDCFRFFNEKEVLELRYHILKDYVDQFIILEGTRTHSGNPWKPLSKKIINELNLPEEKFIIIETELPGNDEEIYNNEIDYIYKSLLVQGGHDTDKNRLNAITRERIQFDGLHRIIDEFNSDDIFIVSDCDEIINPDYIDHFCDQTLNNPNFLIKIPMVELQGRANLRAYDKETNKPKSPYYSGVFVCTKDHICKNSLLQLRVNANNPYQEVFISGGEENIYAWHFTWMGGAEKIKIKCNSTVHYSDKLPTVISENLLSIENQSHIQNWKPMNGVISPYGETNTILKYFPIEKLPKQIFEIDHLKDFFIGETENVLDLIDWGSFENKPSVLEFTKNEIKYGIYTKFFDVEVDDVVFDIGSSVGPFSVVSLYKSPKEIHCFEPSKELFDSLVNNLKDCDNVFLNNYAITGEDNLNSPINLDSVLSFDNTESNKFTNTIKFKTYIDNKNIEKIDFLKIDTEGGEWDVFTEENYDWISNNVKKVSGEFHLSTYEMKQKFIKFRNLYLRDVKILQAFCSNQFAEVAKIDIWDDNYVMNNLNYCIISFEFGKKTKEDTKKQICDLYPKMDAKYGTWGWCSLDKAGYIIDCIDKICNEKENPVCVEIGVYGGKSVVPVALELKRHKKGIIHAIDPWTNEEATKGYDGPHLNFWGNLDLNLIYKIFLEIIGETSIQDYVNIIKKPSDDAPDFDYIDYLYIDGQHTMQAFKDADKYATKIRPGGYCFIDDVNWGELETNNLPKYIESLGFEYVHSVDACYVYKKPTEIPVFEFNSSTSYKNTVWVVDNFYKDPDAVREFALKQEYFEGGFGRGFIGRRTEKQFLFPGLKEKFEEIMGMKITNWKEHGMNGRFQNCYSGEPLVYHCDSQKWGGMLYLTPNAPYQCGTTLHASKKTRARTYYDQGWDSDWEYTNHLDRTPFEPVDVVGNVYNRLMIFDASCIHSASEYFGTVMENSRLWQMFFFDTEGWESPLVF